MTNIGSTSYLTNSRHINSNRSNSDGSYNRTSVSQDSETKSGNTLPPNAPGAQPVLAVAASAVKNGLPNQAATLMGPALRAVDTLKQIDILDLTEAQYNTFLEQNQDRIEANTFYLKSQYTDWSSTATVEASLAAYPSVSTPATLPYATVVVSGSVVATIDNQGVVESDNDLGERLQSSLLDEINEMNGPDLAQERADKIAKILGGSVVRSDTAITQSAFDALPFIDDQRPKANYEAMKRDPLYQQLQSMYDRMEQTGYVRGMSLASYQDSVLFYA